ncbi:MAG: alpha/beta hydrolase family protein [Bryobacteraceae bacterium]
MVGSLRPRLYSRWISRWEERLANLDPNREPRPFEWGLDWLGLEPANGHSAAALAEFSRANSLRSGEFFSHATPRDFSLTQHAEGQTLEFASPVETPFPENNRVYAEYLPARNHDGRAVLVIPQWNSDERSHISLCRLLNRFGLSALRLSKAYHHRRKPAGSRRADLHVSSNLGLTIHATRQSVLDARCCLDWLSAQGYHRLGILGTSLGSCVALLTMAHDHRIKTGVFNHVSLNFSDVVWTGVSCRHVRETLEGNVTQQDLVRYWNVISPAAYLNRLAGRGSNHLLVWGAYDTTFRPEYSRQAIEGFRANQIPHQVFRLPCGHYTNAKFPYNWMDGLTMSRFLRRHS